MTTRWISTITLWVLNKSLSGPDHDAIVGDILEQHQRGRSDLWLCVQTFAAIATSTVRDLWARPVQIAVASFFVGYGVAALLGTLGHVAGLRTTGLDAVLVAVGTGWVLGRVGRLTTVTTFIGIAWLMSLATLYDNLMGFLDHFRGVWLVAHYGVSALPSSLALSQVCVLIGGALALHDTPHLPT
jgi:hypothetical protein